MLTEEQRMDRFWQRVEVTGFCWNYIGWTDKNGYGRTRWSSGMVLTHRLAYEQLVGEIPDGLLLDHLCRNTSCVNPDHLEPVTSQVNTLRGFSVVTEHAKKTHCPYGHEYTSENTRLQTRPSGTVSRACKACEQVRHSQPAYIENAKSHQKKRLLQKRLATKARKLDESYTFETNTDLGDIAA